jgi:hypothetical protein
MIVGNVPTQGVPESQEELRVLFHAHVAGGVGVVVGPDLAELIGELRTEEFALSLRCALESLNDYGNEDSHEHYTHNESIAVKEELREKEISTTLRGVIVIDVVKVFGVFHARIGGIIRS